MVGVLNPDQLARACQSVEETLSGRTDLLVLSKFGKTEAEGGGFRGLLARALELSVPVLIGIPLVNLSSFREFCRWPCEGDRACRPDVRPADCGRAPAAQSSARARGQIGTCLMLPVDLSSSVARSSLFVGNSTVADIYLPVASQGRTRVPLDSPEWRHRYGEVR
ncbi:DUF2478 domain-containing protein [Mesorhizobium atlanticum]